MPPYVPSVRRGWLRPRQQGDFRRAGDRGSGLLLSRPPHPWTFIAEEIEPGGSPADAGTREVNEETGLLVTAGQEIGRRVHPATGRTMIYMAAKPTDGTDLIVGDRDELAEVRRVRLTEAEQLIRPYGMFGPVREHLPNLLR